VGWGEVADEFGELLKKNVKDPELREWIVPGFSTTTETDRIVGSVMMMGKSCLFPCAGPPPVLTWR
jgi:hypothetical protein